MDASDSAPARGGATPFVDYPASAALPGWREAGSGRPLLLLHGWSVSGNAFLGQAALAESGYRVIAPDHAGHGLSCLRGSQTASIASLAADTAALIRHLNLRDVIIVGWSMGAMVAWELMRSEPGLPLAAIGAIDMTPRLVTSPDWPHGLHGHYDSAQATQMATRIRKDWHRLAPSVAAGLWADGRQPDAGLVARVEAMNDQCDAAALAALWEDMARQDFREALRAATLPLFHLYGERSRLYAPAVGRATLALRPDAGFATIADTGHSPHMECPQAFNASLLALCDQASTR